MTMSSSPAVEPLALPRLLPLEPGLISHVALNMRPADAREIFACRADDDPTALAWEIMTRQPLGTVIATRLPVAVVGAAQGWPGFFRVFMFATPAWPTVSRCTTRYVRKTLIPALLARGARRAECRSSADHHHAHRWLEALGAVREAVLPDHGRNGETFYQYAWRLSDPQWNDWRQSHVQFRQPSSAPAPSAASAGTGPGGG